VAFLLLLGLKRPLWAVAALLVSELTLTSQMFDTPFGVAISLRLIIIIICGLILLRSFVNKEVNFGPKARLVFIPAIIFVGLCLVSDIIYSGFDSTFKEFRTLFISILIIMYIPAVTGNLRDLKTLYGVAFITIAASAAIGIMQYLHILGMQSVTLTPYLLSEGGARVPGIAENPLYLSFTLPLAAVITTGVYFTRGVNSARGLVLLSILLISLAIYLTYTRSALLALLFGLFALILFLKTRIRWQLVLLIVLVGLLFIELTGVMEGRALGGRSEAEQASSAYERQVLWQAGFYIALDNPILGIGGGRFKAVSPRYASRIDPELMKIQETYWEYRTLGSQNPHNDFMMVWVSYGTLALLVYLWLFIALLSRLRSAYLLSKGRFIKGLLIGLAAALVAYVANAFYHNCIAAMPLFWLLAGFSMATAKFALIKNANEYTQKKA
jgi:O-antigen ligase